MLKWPRYLCKDIHDSMPDAVRSKFLLKIGTDARVCSVAGVSCSCGSGRVGAGHRPYSRPEDILIAAVLHLRLRSPRAMGTDFIHRDRDRESTPSCVPSPFWQSSLFYLESPDSQCASLNDTRSTFRLRSTSASALL